MVSSQARHMIPPQRPPNAAAAMGRLSVGGCNLAPRQALSGTSLRQGGRPRSPPRPGRAGLQVSASSMLDGVFPGLSSLLAGSAGNLSLASLKVPEKMVIGNMSTSWELSDFWIIPATFLAMKPMLVICYSVCSFMSSRGQKYRSMGMDFVSQKLSEDQGRLGQYLWHVRRVLWDMEGYTKSWMKTLELPLTLLVAPMAASFMLEQVLNAMHTYKLVKAAPLKKLALVVMEASRFAFLVWAGYSAYHIKSRLLGPIMCRTRAGRQLFPSVSKVLSVAIMLAIIVAGLKLFGLNKESLGLAGASAAAVALASQSIIKSFLASLTISNPMSPFMVGDFVCTCGTAGTVTQIGWLNTAISTPEGPTVYIANEELMQARVLSITRSDFRRMEETFSVVADSHLKIFQAVEDIRRWIAYSGLSEPGQVRGSNQSPAAPPGGPQNRGGGGSSEQGKGGELQMRPGETISGKEGVQVVFLTYSCTGSPPWDSCVGWSSVSGWYGWCPALLGLLGGALPVEFWGRRGG